MKMNKEKKENKDIFVVMDASAVAIPRELNKIKKESLTHKNINYPTILIVYAPAKPTPNSHQKGTKPKERYIYKNKDSTQENMNRLKK